MTIPRRQFLQTAIAAGVASQSVKAAQNVNVSGGVRFGMIGIGMQGSGLLGTAINFLAWMCLARRRSL